MDDVQRRYADIPSDIGRLIEEVELSLQKAEEQVREKNRADKCNLQCFVNVCVCVIQQLIDKNSPVRKLASRARELSSGLERVKVLLEKRSPTVSEAQNAVKVNLLFSVCCVCV